MYFRSALIAAAATGCALIDAAGDLKPVAGEYHHENIGATASPRMAVAADLDGMGLLDVVVLDDSGAIQTAISDGNPGFYLVTPTQLRGYTSIAAVQLFDSPFFDIIAAGPNKLDILTSLGTGQLRATSLTVPAGFMPGKIAAGRILGQMQQPAIAIASASSPQLFVFTTPVTAPALKTIALHTQATDLAIGDIDTSNPGDELIVADDQLAIYTGPNADRKDEPLRGSTGRASHIAIGKLGGGDEVDVAYMHIFQGPAEIDLIDGSPTGLFDPGLPGLAPGVVGDSLLALDLDGDQLTDLATIFTDNSGKHRLVMLRNAGNGSNAFVVTELGVTGAPQAISAGDLDGDGSADFMLVPGAGGGVDLLLSHD
jgi:hypothetical protein